MKIKTRLALVLFLIAGGCSKKASHQSLTAAPTPGPVAEAADAPGCLNAALVNEIRSHIDLKIKDVKTFDRCTPGSNTYKTLETLILIKTMQYSDAALAAPYNQNILPGDFWKYFVDRANTIVEEDKCSTGVLAFVWMIFRDGIIHVCPTIFDDRLLKYERAQAMLHEVRHFEGFGHVKCIRGNRKGKDGSCDVEIEQKGSYAVTVEALTKMALTSKDVPRVQRTLLKTLALSYANDTFNKPVFDHDMAAFYLEDSGDHAYIYSNKGLVNVARLEDATLVSRGATLAVFPTNKEDAYTVNVFSNKMDTAPAAGSFSAEYNSMNQDRRPGVVDIMNLAYVSASITENQIKGSFGDTMVDTVVNVPWKIQAVFSGAEVGAPDEDSLYIKDELNLFRVKFKPGLEYELTQVPNTVGTMKKLIIYNDKRIGLDSQGHVLVQDNGMWIPYAPLHAAVFTKMTRPFMWDQYFEDQEMTINWR